MRKRVLVSACLLGLDCRYDGRDNRHKGVEALPERCEVIPVCPEQLGGLPTPRTPAERLGGKVVSRDGADVTAAFLRGAEQACRLAALFGARYALLKANSPSCGSGRIYDGSFSGRLVPGEGVAASALRKMGVTVYDETQIDALLRKLEEDSL